MPYYELNSKLIGQESLNGGKILKPKYRHYVDKSGLFRDISEPSCSVVAMSDIHSLSVEYVKALVKAKHINSNTVVIMTGDMAGTGGTGAAGDADPYPTYCYVLQHCLALYLVQGNHDIYNSEVKQLKNADGTPCCVDDIVVTTPIGTIGGVNGIVNVTEDHARHKYLEYEYMKKYERVRSQNPDIMLTHQPPRDDMIFAKLHLYGHAHAKKHYSEKGSSNSTCVNMDSRILIMK